MVQTADPRRPDVAIVGAGISGLACARALADAGLACVVFDKSRGLGGRLATRRVDGIGAFDHGAPLVDARRAPFAAFLGAMSRSAAAAPWAPRRSDTQEAGFVGTPTMNAIVKPLAAGLEIRRRTEIASVERAGGRWRLRTKDSVAGDFHIVVLTAPAAQTGAILAEAAPDLAAETVAVTTTPAWTAMLAFDRRLPADIEILSPGAGPIALAVRDSAKPARSAGADCWVVHAGESWSRDHLEIDRQDAAVRLAALASELLGPFREGAVYVAAHRWRYARTLSPAGGAFGSNADATLFAAGDWRLGDRAEDAFESGTAAAEAILKAS